MRGLHMCELEGGGNMRGHCWSCHSCPFLYGGSPFWVICFLYQKKIKEKTEDEITSLGFVCSAN